jgi:release factor glutamine methyltransferase
VFAEDEAELLISAAGSPDELAGMVARRVAGLPLEHIVGFAEFCGRRIAVDPGVFVPRRRTELLVEQAALFLRPGAVVLDLCCGCGAAGTVLAAYPGVEVHAADLDPAAVRNAQRNLAPYGGRAHHGDLYAALPPDLRGRVDVLAVNVPYVPTEAIALMPPEARLHEPALALDGGPDGLDVARRVLAGAGDWLAPGGRLLLETSDEQSATVCALFTAAGLTPRLVHDDDRGAVVAIGEQLGRAPS